MITVGLVAILSIPVLIAFRHVLLIFSTNLNLNLFVTHKNVIVSMLFANLAKHRNAKNVSKVS